MAITIEIAGASLPAGVKFLRNSLGINQEIYGRASLTLSLTDVNGTYRPLAGQSVEVYEDAVLMWAGTIDEPQEAVAEGSPAINWNLTCVDNHQIADRRIVNESFARQPVGDIVRSVITDTLAADGITAGTIHDGPDVGIINAPHMPASQLITELAELVGYYWRINPDKTLDFYMEGTFLAAAIDEDSDLLADSVSVWRDRSEYRNKQTITGIKGITLLQAEIANPSPDGTVQTFYVRFPLAEKPVIEIDDGIGGGWVAVDPGDIGILGLETGKLWYWNSEKNTIAQDALETPLDAPEQIRLKYYGQLNLTIELDDPAAVSERQLVEGGTGLYEHVESMPSVEGVTAGTEKASALLRRYARIAKKATMASESINFQVGEMRQVTLPKHDISGQYMVMSVSISDRGRGDQKLLRSAVLVDGEAIGGYVEFFRHWLEKTRPLTLRENELIRKVQVMRENQGWQGQTTVEAFDCLYPGDPEVFLMPFFPIQVDELYPADDLYPGTKTSETTLVD